MRRVGSVGGSAFAGVVQVLSEVFEFEGAVFVVFEGNPVIEESIVCLSRQIKDMVSVLCINFHITVDNDFGYVFGYG